MSWELTPPRADSCRHGHVGRHDEDGGYPDDVLALLTEPDAIGALGADSVRRRRLRRRPARGGRPCAPCTAGSRDRPSSSPSTVKKPTKVTSLLTATGQSGSTWTTGPRPLTGRHASTPRSPCSAAAWSVDLLAQATDTLLAFGA